MNIEDFLRDRSGANILNCGHYGDGKTSFIAGALNSGLKGVGVCTPQNARVLYSHLTTEGKKNILDLVDMTEKVKVEVYEPSEKDPYGKRGVPVIKMIDDGQIPTVYSSLIRNTTQWYTNYYKKEKLPPYSEWDENYFIFFDDLSALSEDPFSACRIHAYYEMDLLGRPITDTASMRSVGLAQNKVMTMLSGFLAVPKRRHHVVINTHLRQKTINIQNTLTENELNKATMSENKSIRMGVTVKTAELFPVICGDALSANFGKNFDWIIQSVRNGSEEPQIYFKAPSNTHNFNMRTPNVPSLLNKEFCSWPASKAMKELVTANALVTKKA